MILDASDVAPMVTWGTSPSSTLPITGNVPDPAAEHDANKREGIERALAYMDLKPGTARAISRSIGRLSALAPTGASRICGTPPRSSRVS